MDSKQRSPIVSLETLFGKEHRFVSAEEALKDITPPEWSEDVLNGKKQVKVRTKDEVLRNEL